MTEDQAQEAALAELRLESCATDALRRVARWRGQAGEWRREVAWYERHAAYRVEADFRAQGTGELQVQLEIFLSRRTPEELSLISGRLDGLSDLQIAEQLYARGVAGRTAQRRLADVAAKLRAAAGEEL